MNLPIIFVRTAREYIRMCDDSGCHCGLIGFCRTCANEDRIATIYFAMRMYWFGRVN